MRAKRVEKFHTELDPRQIHEVPTLMAERAAKIEKRNSGIRVKEGEKMETEEYFDALQLQGGVVSSIIDQLSEYSQPPSDKDRRRMIAKALHDTADILPTHVGDRLVEFEAAIDEAVEGKKRSEVVNLWDEGEVVKEDSITDAARKTGERVSELFRNISDMETVIPKTLNETERMPRRRVYLLERLAGFPKDESAYEREQESSPVISAKRSVDEALSAVSHFVSLGSESLLRVIRNDTKKNVDKTLPKGAIMEADTHALLRAAAYRKSLMELPSKISHWEERGAEITIDPEVDIEPDYYIVETNPHTLPPPEDDGEHGDDEDNGEDGEEGGYQPFIPRYINKKRGTTSIHLRNVFQSVRTGDTSFVERREDPLYEPLRNATLLVERLRELASLNASDDPISHQEYAGSAKETFQLADRLESEMLSALSALYDLAALEDIATPEQAHLIETLRYLGSPQEYRRIIDFVEHRFTI